RHHPFCPETANGVHVGASPVSAVCRGRATSSTYSKHRYTPPTGPTPTECPFARHTHCPCGRCSTGTVSGQGYGTKRIPSPRTGAPVRSRLGDCELGNRTNPRDHVGIGPF